MLKIKVMTNVERKEDIIPVDTTISSALNNMGFDASNGWQMNGRPVTDTDLTFEELDVADGSTVFLNRIIKADCA